MMLSKEELERLLKDLEELDICVTKDDLKQAEEWLSLVALRGCYSSNCCGTQRMN